MKTLVVLTVIVLVFFALWKKWMSTSPQVKQLIGVLFGLPSVYRQAKKSQSQTGSSSTADAQQSQNEMMMPCARCGLHVLESEGIKLRGQFYCTKAHS